MCCELLCVCGINRYAQQARNIVNVARVNEDPNVRIIRGQRSIIDLVMSRAEMILFVYVMHQS